MDKRTLVLSFVLLAAASGPALAAEKLPLEVVACQAQAWADWTYAAPEGTNPQAYIELKFMPEYGSGNDGWVRVRKAVPNLIWDVARKHVIYTTAAGKTLTCAKRSWTGISPNRRNCYPTGHVALDDGDHPQCGGHGAAVLTGEFVIVD